MILKQANVILKRVEEKDIEMIRNWRNDPKISKYMSFKNYITQEMQKIWFFKINNNKNYFFIINIDGVDIGMTEIKNIDFVKKTAEGGIFIYNDLFINSFYPYIVSYLSLNFLFDELGLEQVTAQILENNRRAIRYNKSLGFLPTGEVSGASIKYILTKEIYLKSKKTIEIMINNLFGENR